MLARSLCPALAAEAACLSPILTQLHRDFINNEITTYDYVGVFILLYTAYRKPMRWSCGRLNPSILSSRGVVCPLSARVCRFPELLQLLGQSTLERLFAPLHSISEITVLDIFQHVRLSGIKKNNDNLVNRAVLNWAMGEWPFQLLHRVPSPMEVLRMQALGTRVITLFYAEQDLSSYHEAMLTYMSGSKIAAKDAFEFLVHDITHMEHFMHSDSHREQVGFMNAMLRLGNGSPRKFFRELFPGDKTLWLELEYLVSDMYVSKPS